MAEDQVMKVEEEEEEFVMVGDGVEDEKAVSQQEAADDDDELDDDGEEERHADDDRRVGAGEAEDDEKREARRVERKTRRQRQKEARDRDQRELRFLRERNEQVERQLGDLARRVSGQEKASIDGRIRQLDNAIASAEDVYAKAIDAGEGKDAAEAQRIRDQLRDQRNHLQQYKEQGIEEPQQAGPDPELIENVKSWHSRNEWFDFGRRDEDSAIAGAVDDRLAAEGWDPTTSEYYEELDRRLSSRLPHLYRTKGNGAERDEDAGDGERKRGSAKSGGPKFRVGGRERALRSNEVHISRERREAMEQAGVWEDPVLRKKYLKRYADWDRENQSNA